MIWSVKDICFDLQQSNFIFFFKRRNFSPSRLCNFCFEMPSNVRTLELRWFAWSGREREVESQQVLHRQEPGHRKGAGKVRNLLYLYLYLYLFLSMWIVSGSVSFSYASYLKSLKGIRSYSDVLKPFYK